jgi:hypothetical protein
MRNTRKLWVVGCALLACVVAFAASAGAQSTRQIIVLTFASPVSLPKLTLPAGTYTFELTGPNRDTVMIFGEHSRFIANARVTAARRAEPGPAAAMFRDASSTMPPRIADLYFAGSVEGVQFVYPKALDNTRTAETTIPQPVGTSGSEWPEIGDAEPFAAIDR